MKKILTNNLGLKILAFIVSFALWLVVVNYDDPVISNTYSGIPVEIINSEALTEQGKVYEVLNNTDTISVTVTGKRTVVESISKENIRAVADIQDLTLMDTIEIQVSTNKNFNQLDDIKSDTAAVELSIENLKEIHLPIGVAVAGEPADGYVVGDIVTNQNTVRISGPESVVSGISYAESEVSVASRTSDITTSSEIRLYDEEGVEIEHPALSLNIRNINISAEILATKPVEIQYEYSGVPEDGYVVSGPLEADRLAIYIAGKQSVLDTISVIEIPAAAINVDGRSETYTTVVDINRYLPADVRIADEDFDGRASVTVNIAKTVTRSLNVPMSNLSIENVPTGMESQILISQDDAVQEENQDISHVYIQIQTEGILEAYTGLTGSVTYGVIDVAEYMSAMDMTTLEPGVYRMEISFSLPESVETVETYYADIKLTTIEN